MMDVITGKTRPDAGTAFFGQTIDLTRLSEPEIAHAGIGRKFQKPTVFEHHTVFENLELAMKADKRVWPTLRAQLDSRRARPHRDDARDDQAAHAKRDRLAGLLSHGQKQWLEIGMLLMQEPQLLLLDEPVAGMTDEETDAHRRALLSRSPATTRWSWSSTTWTSSRASRARSRCCTRAACSRGLDGRRCKNDEQRDRSRILGR